MTHQHCGLGPHTKIGDGHTRIPKQDWNTGLLRNIDNKKELFPYRELVEQDLGEMLLLSTNLQSVLSNKKQDISGLQPCNHTEADT